MDLRQSRIVWALVALGLVYCFPYFPKINSANELPRVYLTYAMVEEGRFDINTGVSRWGGTSDVTPTGTRCRPPKEDCYSNKAPGSSILAIPGYLLVKSTKLLLGQGDPTLGEMMWSARVFGAAVPTFLFLLLLHGFLRELCGEKAALIVVISYGFGTMALTYSLTFLAHQLSAVLVGSGLILLWRWRNQAVSDRSLFWVGFLGGWVVLTDYQAAFALVPMGVWLLAMLVAREQKDKVMAVMWGLGGFAIPTAMLLGYHWVCFGSPFTTGYDVTKVYAFHHQKGFLGADKFRPEALLGSTFAPDNGLFTFAPILLLAAAGAGPMWRSQQKRGLAVVCLSVVAFYLLFVSSLSMWRSHWQLGPRYIVVMLPFLLPFVATAVSSAPKVPMSKKEWVALLSWTMAVVLFLIVLGDLSLPLFYLATFSTLVLAGVAWHWLPSLRSTLACGAALASVGFYSMSSALYPHFPDRFGSPFREVILRLISDDAGPYSLGWLVGIDGIWGLVPFLVLTLGLCIYALTRLWGRLPVIGGLVIAIVWLALIARVEPGDRQDDIAYKRHVLGVMPQD